MTRVGLVACYESSIIMTNIDSCLEGERLTQPRIIRTTKGGETKRREKEQRETERRGKVNKERKKGAYSCVVLVPLDKVYPLQEKRLVLIDHQFHPMN